MSIRILTGDCREVLATLPADSVQCVVTSPPYYGLRDYQTGTWSGGDPACDHGAARIERRQAECQPTLGGGVRGSLRDKPVSICGCGATRIDKQIGLEESPAEYVAALVEVFRELRRILRSDGVAFLNLGSSYSTGKGSDLRDCLNAAIKGGSIFYCSASAVAATAHCVEIAADHQGSPDGELSLLLTPKRDGIENRDEHFGQIRDLFAGPRHSRRRAIPAGMAANVADARKVADRSEHLGIIGSERDANAKPELGILRPGSTWSGVDHEAPLAIDDANEPSRSHHVCWHTSWDAFAGYAVGKSVVNLDLVNEAVSLGNRLDTLAGLLGDFRIAEASQEKVTFASIDGRLRITVADVGHLRFVLADGCVVPYASLYTNASQIANELRAKQDLCIPWRVATALQRDGWILRAPIIWHKPAPMPESVRDRCTRAHEYVFHLAKSERYFWDAAAIAEAATQGERFHGAYAAPGQPERLNGRNGRAQDDNTTATRNARTVWTIGPEPFTGAHYAVMPSELASRCIKAGSREGDTVLDPFAGAGTTLLAADRLRRHGIGIELNPANVTMTHERLTGDAPLFAEVA